MRLASSTRRNVVHRNLELCFPEKSQSERDHILRESFKSAGRGIFSWGFALFASEQRLDREIVWHGHETLQNFLNSNESAILLCPHFVTPMLTLRAIGRITPVIAMYLPPRNPVFDDGYHCALTGIKSKHKWLNRLYRKRGQHNIKMVSAIRNMKPFYRALQRSVPFFYLPDRNANIAAHTVFAPFFGVEAATYCSLTRFAMFRQSRIFLCYAVMLSDASGYELHTELLPKNFVTGDLETDAENLNNTIEKLVRRLPEQYFWLHRRFKTRPKGEPPIY